MSMYLSVLKCKVRLVLQDVNFLRSLFSTTDNNVKVGSFGKNVKENLILYCNLQFEWLIFSNI